MYGSIKDHEIDYSQENSSPRFKQQSERVYGRYASSPGVFAVIMAVILFTGYMGMKIAHPFQQQAMGFRSLESDYSLNFRVYNEMYSDKPGEGYSFFRLNRLVEPFRESVFEVYAEHHEGSVLDISGIGFSFSDCGYSMSLRMGGGPWDEFPNTISSLDWKPSGHLSENFTIKEFFPSPGSYHVNITCNRDHKVMVLLDNVDCYYVRRELRKISYEEKEEFLTSFIKMHETPTEKGIIEFGNHYRSLADFQIMHLRAAGARELDHIHDGLGIVTQHVSITSEFELSLQSLKPHLSVPYWDYTIDSVKMETTYGRADISSIIKYSALFESDWFGKTNSEAHTVTEGRFAYFELERNYNYTTRSPYGFLRAPWNINPNKYVTRYHKICGSATYSPDLTNWEVNLMWPTCESHFRMSNSIEESSWYYWAWNISYMPHGPVHAWIGGVGGSCEEFDSIRDHGWIDDYQLLLLKHNAFIILKNAWRKFLIETPQFCSVDTPVSDCMWVCHQNISTQHHTKMLLRAYGDINVTSPYFEDIALKVFCKTPYWPGDHLEASSPVEASFWPIHPTLDRLLQYKYLVRPFTNSDWILNNETSKYCTNEVGCKGHHEYDLTFWKTVSKSKSGVYETRHATNLELREMIKPTGDYSVPYIYDFGWPHCADVGVNFKSVTSA